MNWLVNWIIKHAQKTPYFHLDGYMERWWFIKPRKWLPISARVHHILRSDDDRALHDHPWPYLTIILKGGYHEITKPSFCQNAEHVCCDHWEWYGPGSILRRKATDAHRLVVAEGQTAWTLFIMGRYKQGWGFLTPEGKVPWRKYLGEEQPEYDAVKAQHFPWRKS